MKKLSFAFALVAILLLSACGGGKPNMDDPKAVAKFYCDKYGELYAILNQPVDSPENSAKMNAIEKEMDAFEKDFAAHFGDKAESMRKEINDIQKTMCPETAKGF